MINEEKVLGNTENNGDNTSRDVRINAIVGQPWRYWGQSRCFSWWPGFPE